MHLSSTNLPRRSNPLLAYNPLRKLRFLRRSSALCAWLLLCAITSLGGCSSREFDAVKEYKVFLGKAKPSLASMNKSREELYQLSDPEQMLPLFRDKLLPQVEDLRQLARDQPPPETYLGKIHIELQQTLERYADSTKHLVERLKSKSDDEREQAIVLWGEDDQKFGREMSALVDNLSQYLDKLKK